MRTWKRSAVDTLCGGPCNQTVIHVGDPVQIIELAGLSRKLTRCRFCADSDVPPDLPAEIVNRGGPIVPTLPMHFTRFSGQALPFDYKQAAAGREVGSDDE